MEQKLIRTRLSVMLLLQYFVWGSWAVSIGTYMVQTLDFDGRQVGWIYATTAIGALISPLLVGYIADRHIASEKLLAVLHLFSGISLWQCASVERGDFRSLMGLMVVNAICCAPAVPLTNALCFRNVVDRDRDFPFVRFWGTVGWVIGGLIVGILLGESSQTFFRLAGGTAFFAAAYCMTLPHTPPQPPDRNGERKPILAAWNLFRDRSFLTLNITTLLISIVSCFLFVGGNLYLTENRIVAPTAVQTIGQVAECVFVLLLPIALSGLGLKRTFLIGIAAWAVRYLCFATLNLPLLLIGLLLHGFAHNFCFVTAAIYLDRRAPSDLRSSVQSMFVFFQMGIGMLLGTNIAGAVLEFYSPQISVMAVGTGDTAPIHYSLPTWRQLTETFGVPEKAPIRLQHIQTTFLRSQGTADTRDAPAGKNSILIGENNYDQRELAATLVAIDINHDGQLSWPEWRSVANHRWPMFWLWPVLLTGFALVIFWAGFKEEVLIQ